MLNTNLDANENIFLSRELEQVRAETHKIEYPDNEGRILVPIDHEVDRGAESVNFKTVASVGQSRIGGGYSTPAPRVDVSISDESQRIVSITNAYGYNFQEVRNAIFAKRPISRLRAETARDVMEADLSDLLLLGNSAEGLAGLFTLPNALSYTIPNGAAASPLWTTKTSIEIVNDMHAMATTIRNFTKKKESPDTLVLPDSAYDYIATTPMGTDGNSVTILQYFLRNDRYIKYVESSLELEANAGWTGRRMLAYKRDKKQFVGVIPQEFEQFAPQQVHLETVVTCHMRYGGLEVYKPKSFCYADGF